MKLDVPVGLIPRSLFNFTFLIVRGVAKSAIYAAALRSSILFSKRIATYWALS